MGMECMLYAMWYKKDVKPNLTEKQKDELLHKISDLSLRIPIHLPNTEIPLDDFPELKPFAHTGSFSGLQLMTVMTEIFDEIKG